MGESQRELLIGEKRNVALFAELDTQLEEAEELRARSEGLAEGLDPKEVAGRWLVGLVTAVYEVIDLSHPFFGPVFMGSRSRLVAGGCDLLICANRPTRAGDPRRAAAVDRTIGRGVDALMVWGIGNDDPELGPILEAGLPTVFVDHDPLGKRTAHVMSDNVSAMTEMVDHLYLGGRRHIAHIAGNQNTRAGLDRLFGYRSQLSHLGLEAPEEYVQQGNYYHRSAYEGARRLLALPEPPDAITCASDMMAVGAMLAIEEAGLHVPEDVALTGFDDAEFATRLKPPLTTVRQDAHGLGTAAAETLLRMLADPEAVPSVVVLPAELVIRESSGPAAKS
jgi:LacI family transcriptional regulator